MKTRSRLEVESTAIMRGQPPGAALRVACAQFEVLWATAIKSHLPAGHCNKELEATVKRIARLAYLEGRGL